MTISELQNLLISDIQQIKNKNFLNAIYSIVHSGSTFGELNQEQKESIRVSRRQISKGEFKYQDVMIDQMKQWLKEK